VGYHSVTRRISLANSAAASIPEDVRRATSDASSDLRHLAGRSGGGGGGVVDFRAMSRREKLTFINFCVTNLCAGCFYSLIGPFFPTEVVRPVDVKNIGDKKTLRR